MTERQIRKTLNDNTNLFFCHVVTWAIDTACILCIHTCIRDWILRSLKTQAFLFLVLATFWCCQRRRPWSSTCRLPRLQAQAVFFWSCQLGGVCLLVKWSLRKARGARFYKINIVIKDIELTRSRMFGLLFFRCDLSWLSFACDAGKMNMWISNAEIIFNVVLLP